MEESKKQDCFDLFAWLIYKEVEQYVNEHSNAYNALLRERATEASNTNSTNKSA